MRSILSKFALVAAFGFALSCSSTDEQKPSNGEVAKFCVYKDSMTCYSTSQTTCPVGGELSDFCPYEGSNVASSPSVVPSSNSTMPLSSSSMPSSSSIALSSAVISSSSANPNESVECEGYCKWDDGCVRIATDPKGVRDPGKTLPPILSCDEAISNCKLYSPTGKVFSNSTCDNNSVSSSSSSVVRSSSSIAPSSSSSNLTCTADNNTSTQYCSNGTVKQYGSVQTYKTVVIGTQTWMAENLNDNVSGSRCYGDVPANCTTYGRLYSWATAMALPSNCNSNFCASQISEQHKGICPSGWHIPSWEEWTTLKKFVGSPEAKKLMATSGWKYEGTDDYGFAALPGGTFGLFPALTGSYEGFTNGGNIGCWWSNYEYGINESIRQYISDPFTISNDCGDKPHGCSVRCLQDYYVAPSSSKGDNIANYKTTKIGNQVWMAENLDYKVNGSKCYGNETANCEKYGRLYSWAIAMALPDNCNSNRCASRISAKHRGICPSGWHIPSNKEWETLVDFVGTDAGTKLKATSGWNSNGNGTDAYGFSALPGGGGYSVGSFDDVGNYGYWWSASEDVSYLAYRRRMSYNDENANNNFNGKDFLLSVRCLQD
jgi:uncharacterized protein (TIGR02145 family)